MEVGVEEPVSVSTPLFFKSKVEEGTAAGFAAVASPLASGDVRTPASLLPDGAPAVVVGEPLPPAVELLAGFPEPPPVFVPAPTPASAAGQSATLLEFSLDDKELRLRYVLSDEGYTNLTPPGMTSSCDRTSQFGILPAGIEATHTWNLIHQVVRGTRSCTPNVELAAVFIPRRFFSVYSCEFPGRERNIALVPIKADLESSWVVL